MKPYEIITDRILDMLDSGTVPWRKPWTATGGLPRNLVSGKPYRGINVFLTLASDYASPYWLTYKQAKDRGGQVRKGEKGTPVVFWNFRTVTIEDEEEKNIPYMRYYTVFNTYQIDGLKLEAEIPARPVNTINACEDIISNMPNMPEIKHGFNRACYVPSSDIIQMPLKSAFHSDAEYYAALFHEVVHATAHKARLDRKDQGKVFGDADYSREELIAEFGSAYLCGITGISPKTINNSAAYIAGWSKSIAGDKRMVISAASQAQKAVDYILRQDVVTAKEAA